jgi:hypothetical protein
VQNKIGSGAGLGVQSQLKQNAGSSKRLVFELVKRSRFNHQTVQVWALGHVNVRLKIVGDIDPEPNRHAQFSGKFPAWKTDSVHIDSCVQAMILFAVIDGRKLVHSSCFKA